ncbi:hypothetical protein [Streptosporangium saharense]|uniref:hypothetical protein n=1 Tax=Streptosporangium saharense TaxID=1706840 RepID=UPI00332A67AF
MLTSALAAIGCRLSSDGCSTALSLTGPWRHGMNDVRVPDLVTTRQTLGRAKGLRRTHQLQQEEAPNT